ncbi:hypothetical protein SCLCIDRAFT_1224668 [Scleroderma citrinum Foug A]|uniref:Uncharacterized protein n=1 Tax=Scleroderma citrinum Foug A TaxID=1036808 RepID=A0A0C2ZE98_9AGAM|nr:hypothetical protein SCLCIDRAFT_1224668 [Scleroderma citrinum Foug A]
MRPILGQPIDLSRRGTSLEHLAVLISRRSGAMSVYTGRRMVFVLRAGSFGLRRENET